MEKKQLNICLMNDSFPPTIDGVANCVLNYAEIINRKFGNVFVCTPHYPGVEDRYDFPVIRYPSVNLSHAFGYRAGLPFDVKTIRRLQQLPIDLIHVHCPIMSAVLARVLRELIDKPIVLTYHTKFDVDIEKDISSKAMQEQAIRSIVSNIEACDEVWTVSKGAGENLRSLGFSGEYRVMENGVDFTRGCASPEAVSAARARYSLPEEIPVFLFVGRMMWYKGIRTILDGLARLHAAKQPFRMLFIGDGADKGEIVAYAQELGLASVCQFLPPISDREELRTFYTLADLFLFPSDFDTNGLVVHEAAAGATASATLRDSCASEGMIDGRNGLIVDRTPESLAAACKAVLVHPEKLKELG
ncbi:MAG: glycosyltransferase, partial [Clostridia bacterium]|nr:glycosyltransferase [Clostridia bacterium]